MIGRLVQAYRQWKERREEWALGIVRDANGVPHYR